MALETIQQILSPTKAPYINGVAAQLRFSPAVLKNMYQGLVEKDGKGVDDNYVTASEAEDSAQIMVHRVLPIKMLPREQGANKNGASYSANQHYVQTTTVAIEILQVIDDPVKVPRARQDMIPVDLLAEQTQIFSDRLATILNGATAASKLLAVYNAKAAGKEVNEKIISNTDVTNKEVNTRFIEANSLLDEGDEDNGIDIFPTKTRVAVFKPSYRATLKTAGVLTLNGNDAFAILAKASISKEADARIEDDGYIGVIDGVECRVISNESLGHASEFLGFPRRELAKNGIFIGYIASSYANARGVSTSARTKVVDETLGQGVILQPYVKFGVASWYPKGNVIFVNREWSPIEALRILTNNGLVTYKVKGVGSRLVPEFSSVGATSSALTATVSALDDWGQDHIVGIYAISGDYNSVGEFLEAAVDLDTETSSAEDVSSGTASGTYSGKYTFLAISDDGTIRLATAEVA